MAVCFLSMAAAVSDSVTITSSASCLCMFARFVSEQSWKGGGRRSDPDGQPWRQEEGRGRVRAYLQAELQRGLQVGPQVFGRRVCDFHQRLEHGVVPLVAGLVHRLIGKEACQFRPTPTQRPTLCAFMDVHTCRIPGSRSAKCFSSAVFPSLDRTNEAAARAAKVWICRGEDGESLCGAPTAGGAVRRGYPLT